MIGRFLSKVLILGVAVLLTTASCVANNHPQLRELQTTVSFLHTQVALERTRSASSVTPGVTGTPVVPPAITRAPSIPEISLDKPNTSDLKIIPRPQGAYIIDEFVSVIGCMVRITYKYIPSSWDQQGLAEYFQRIMKENGFVMTERVWNENRNSLFLVFQTNQPVGDSGIKKVEIRLYEDEIDLEAISKYPFSSRDFVANIFQNQPIKPDQPNTSDLKILPRPERSYIYDFLVRRNYIEINYIYDRVYWSDQQLAEYFEKVLTEQGFTLTKFTKDLEEDCNLGWFLEFDTNEPIGDSGIYAIHIEIRMGCNEHRFEHPESGAIVISAWTKQEVRTTDFVQPVVLFFEE